MPKPTVEQIKKWYESFVQKAATKGINLNSLTGRMQVLAMYINEDSEGEDISKAYFAYMPANDEGGYDVLDEEYSEADGDKLFMFLKNTVTNGNVLQKNTEKLKEAGMKGKYSRELVNSIDEYRKQIDRLKADKISYLEESEKVYSGYDKWLANNLKPLNPNSDADLEHIGKLYNLASEGKLMLMDGLTAAGSAMQIYVNSVGECGITKHINDYRNVSNKNLFGEEPVIMGKKDYERCLENPEVLEAYQKKCKIVLSDPIKEEEKKALLGKMFEAAYPDADPEQRAELSNNICVSEHAILFSSTPDRKQHINELIKYNKDYCNFDKHGDYLEAITAGDEGSEAFKNKIKAESIKEINEDAEKRTKALEDAAAPIYAVEAEEIEKLKVWYKSFSDEVKKLGGDLDNPADMMNVSVFLETYQPETPLTNRLAFVSMDKKGNYNDPEPIVSEQACEQFVMNSEESGDMSKKASQEYEKAAARIEENKLQEAYETAAMGDFYRDKAAQAMASQMDEAFALNAKRDAWLVRNLKPIDFTNPADVEKVRVMYRQASKGLLSYSQNPDINEMRQVNVSDDGSCNISVAYKETPLDLNPTWEQLVGDKNAIYNSDNLKKIFNKHSEIKAKYEEIFNRKVIDQIPLPEKPANLARKPEQPPKPGILSALKWFFSFGKATADYDAYESYETRLREYNAGMDEYRNEVRRITANNAAAAEQWIQICRDIGHFRHQDAPEKADMLDNNYYRIYNQKIEMNSQTIQPLGSLPVIDRHISKLWHFAKENPEILSENNIDDNGNFIKPQIVKDADSKAVADAVEKMSSKYSDKLLRAQITQEVSRMDIGVDMVEMTRNIQLLSMRMYNIMAPCAIPEKELNSPEQLISSVEAGNVGDLKVLTADSKLAATIKAFGRPNRKMDSNEAALPKDAADYEEGLAMLVGMLNLADKTSFSRLVDYTLYSDKDPDRLNKKYPDEMQHLRNVSETSICNNRGEIDKEKYVKALRSVIEKATASIFKNDGRGLDAERVAMCCLTSRLSDKLEELGRGDFASEDERKKIETVKQIPFIVNAFSAGFGAEASFAEGSGMKEESRRTLAESTVRGYSKCMSAAMLHSVIDTAFKTGDLSNLALIKDTQTTLAAMRGFAGKIKEVKDPLDFTNLQEPDVRRRISSNFMAGKDINGKSLDADEPVRLTNGPELN